MPTKTFISADTSSQQSHNSSCCIPVWFTLLVIIATVANIAATWLIAQESTTVNRENTTRMVQAIDKANEMGLLQFGNAENLELYKKVQALKAPEINKQIQAELSKAQAGTAAQAPAVIDNAAPQAMKKLTDEQVKSLLANNYIEGQAVAKITIAEFSDFECPYCIRHFSDGVVKALLKKYSTSVNFTFHPIVLANHPN